MSPNPSALCKKLLFLAVRCSLNLLLFEPNGIKTSCSIVSCLSQAEALTWNKADAAPWWKTLRLASTFAGDHMGFIHFPVCVLEWDESAALYCFIIRFVRPTIVNGKLNIASEYNVNMIPVYFVLVSILRLVESIYLQQLFPFDACDGRSHAEQVALWQHLPFSLLQSIFIKTGNQWRPMAEANKLIVYKK